MQIEQKLKQLKLRRCDVAKLTGLSLKTVSRTCKIGIQTTRLAKIYASALQCDPHEIIEL